jgi:solute carrier family 25 protein 38
MVSTTLLQPLDVIKTHMQAAESVHSRKFGAVLKNILAEDGVRGLWRGTGPACVRVGFGAGLYFAVLGPMLDTLKKTFGGSSSSVVAGGGEGATGGALRDKLPAFVTLSAGALTRALASSVVCPITVIKTRMEVWILCLCSVSGFSVSPLLSALGCFGESLLESVSLFPCSFAPSLTWEWIWYLRSRL